MQLQSVTSSQDMLRPSRKSSMDFYKEERRRTGRYLAGGVALTIILIGIYHVAGRSASSAAGIWSPAIIMALYIVWVLYAARKDRMKATRLESAMNLTKLPDTLNSRHIMQTSTSNNSCKLTKDVVIHV